MSEESYGPSTSGWNILANLCPIKINQNPARESKRARSRTGRVCSRIVRRETESGSQERASKRGAQSRAYAVCWATFNDSIWPVRSSVSRRVHPVRARDGHNQRDGPGCVIVRTITASARRAAATDGPANGLAVSRRAKASR